LKEEKFLIACIDHEKKILYYEVYNTIEEEIYFKNKFIKAKIHTNPHKFKINEEEHSIEDLIKRICPNNYSISNDSPYCEYCDG